MPARDRIHEAARNAIVNDGWTITHDPYRIRYGPDDLYVDLGAEMPIAAERGGRKIAVEIKGFRGPSPVFDFERALGQYILYRTLIEDEEPDRMLYLAVPSPVYDASFQRPMFRAGTERNGIRMIVFQPVAERIVRWIP